MAGSKFNLDKSPGHMLRRASQFAYDLFSKEVGSGGLTPRQFAVLITVSQNEGLSQTDLVRLTGIDRSTLADMISRMLKSGLLGRRRTKDDARANAVLLTAKGRSALSKALSKVAAADKRILGSVPAKHRAAFMAALAAIADATSEGEGTAPKAKKKAAKKKAAKKASKKPATRKVAKKASKRRATRAANKRRVATKASK